MFARRSRNHSAEYRAHIASPKWRRIRRLALERAAYSCAVCNSSSQLRVHHKHYRTLGNERPEDLTVLCHPCHVLADERRRAASGSTRRPPQRKRRRRGLSKPLREMRTLVMVLVFGVGGLKLASIVLPALSS